MAEGTRCTLFMNDTDTGIKIVYDCVAYILKPKTVASVRWHSHDRNKTLPPQIHLEWVKLDHKISLHDLYDNRGITIFRAANNSCLYSFRTLSSLSSKDMNQVSLLPLWVSCQLRWTKFVNTTDSEIHIEYDGVVYTLEPKRDVFVRWLTYDVHRTLILPRLQVKGIELGHNISLQDVYENVEIIIFRGVDNAYTFRTLSDKDLKQRLRESLQETMNSIEKLLPKMEELLKKARIWRKQCEHLLDNYRKGVDMIVQVLGALREGPERVLKPHLVKFICSMVICCMLEGKELLLFCGENDYNKAAFALSSPQSPSVPTFSRFALVLRKLLWTLDFICFVEYGNSSFDDWEWCEKSWRLIYDEGNFRMELGVMEENSLEADAHRRTDDREALWTYLQSKLSSNPLFSNTLSVSSPSKYGGILFLFRTLYGRLGTEPHKKDNEDKLEGMWKKRLLATSDSSEPISAPTDWFWIDKPDFKVVKLLGSGSCKRVNECEWLGELMAVALLDISKEQAEAEASILARVQHPNVVELMGYAYKDDIRNPQGFLVTELMEQDLESLISQQWNSLGSRTTFKEPPFALPVAVDIVIQIVEAMIHLKECGVLHRDLKPKNCLASPKYRKDSVPTECSDILIYYTIKLIDFGAAKMRDQDSYFHSYKQGTP